MNPAKHRRTSSSHRTGSGGGRKPVRSGSAYKRIRRAADVAISGTALFLLSPLLAGIALAIKLDSRGPVIFRQTRVGIRKTHFEIYKFRTMYSGTPKDMPTHLLQDPDAMVTRVGRVLRKYSLDELPQLVNIVKGDMSIVGPRPALWNQYDLIRERDRYGANDVMPGLTGWAQINGRDELEIPAKARLDGYYVKHFGLLMDIRCITGTVAAVLGHKGVVEGGTGQLEKNRSYSDKKLAACVRNQADSLSGRPVRVLITGAHSYIGTAVRRWLEAFGGHYEVQELDLHGAEWKKFDFSGFDTVFHVAGIAHADVGAVSDGQKKLYYEVNRDLAIETARRARESGVGQFLYMSSMIVYGDSAPYGKRRRITAETKPEPANFYGDSKWQGDKGVRALETEDFAVCVLRPPMVYGKGSRGNYPLLARLACHMPVFPDVGNERSVLHIDNLCEFVRLMIENRERGVFFPQNDTYVNTSTLVRLIASAHGRRLKLVRQLNWAVRLASVMPGRIGALADKAFGSFSYDLSMSEYARGGYRVHNLKESIRATER